jgi:hypothetical protein
MLGPREKFARSFGLGGIGRRRTYGFKYNLHPASSARTSPRNVIRSASPFWSHLSLWPSHACSPLGNGFCYGADDLRPRPDRLLGRHRRGHRQAARFGPRFLGSRGERRRRCSSPTRGRSPNGVSTTSCSDCGGRAGIAAPAGSTSHARTTGTARELSVSEPARGRCRRPTPLPNGLTGTGATVKCGL